LKALDAGLRMSLRRELLLMAKSKLLELTVIHVTNEEQEAMMVADRIALLNKGKIEQVGIPYEIYYQPKNLFVANFMSEINYFSGIYIENKKASWDINKNGKHGDRFFSEIKSKLILIAIDIGVQEVFASYVQKSVFDKLQYGDKLLLVARANHMKIRLGNRIKDKHNALVGKIYRRKFMGVFYRFEVLVNINGEERIIIVTNPATTEIHKTFLENLEVTIYFPKELGILFKHPGDDVIKEVLKLE